MAILTKDQILLSKSNDFICKRDALMETKGVTLDGRPAYISGRLCKFALVWCPDEDDMHQAYFSWDVVERIIKTNGGAFYSNDYTRTDGRNKI